LQCSNFFRFSGIGPFSGLCAFLQGYPLSISWGSIPSSFFPFTFSILIISLQDFCIGGLLRPAGCFGPQGVSFGHTCHRPKSTTQVATLLCQKNISRYQKKSSLWLEVQHLHWSLQWQGWQPAHASCFFHWAGLQRGN
jgi:hypothetical protein